MLFSIEMSIRKKLYDYWARPNIRAAVQNSGILFVDKAIRLGAGLLVGLWVARYMGPENYGLFGYGLSLVGVISTFSLLGLDGIMVRWLVRYPRKSGQILGTGIVLRGVASGILFLLLMGWAFTGEAHLNKDAIFFLGLSLLIQPLYLLRYYFDAKLMAKSIVRIELTSFLLCTFIKIIIVYCEGGLALFFAVYTLEVLISVLGISKLFSNVEGLARCRFSMKIARLLIRHGVPVVLLGSAVIIYMRIDQVMLLRLSTLSQAGFYAAATRLSEIWAFVPAALAASASPAIIRAGHQNRRLYLERLQRLASFLTLLSYLVVAFVGLSAKWVVPVLFGDNYAPAATMLMIHIFGQIGIFQAYVTWIYYTNEKLSRIVAVNLWLVAFFNVGFNMVAIPLWGGVGAAIATALSYSVCIPFCAGLFKRSRPMFWVALNAFWLKGLFPKSQNTPAK
ncbi:flippase [bacterium]|nr:flippase [bacterium]